MKAFMSTDESPNRQSLEQDQFDGRPLGLQTKAVREARAILAETEPAAKQTATWSASWAWPNRVILNPRGQEMVGALADALRAFVEE